ncbi:MAG: Methionine synthase, partial [Pseudomonadota bacterium]
VHDIGKNIVTVVLQCNNFDVYNMGVMVPWQDVLAKAKEVNADMVGLSGLITPSLEEMQVVASEMQKDPWFRDRKIPLLIGGATTSRVHTAVKIAPLYDGPVVYVPDASRSVAVGQGLLGEEASAYLDALRADYDKVRAQHAGKKQTPLWTLEQARANATSVEFGHRLPSAPRVMGRRVLKNVAIDTLLPFIDWTPFFQTWDLAGSFPAILEDEVVGAQAKQVYVDAQSMLKKVIEGRWLEAHAVFGLYPAQRQGHDDIAFYADDTCQQTLMVWHGLRQQAAKETVDGVTKPSRCLADFVASPMQGADHAGMFAVSVHGAEKKAEQFVQQHDDYSAIMIKALADRLAEALAEYLHWRVRTEWWGYAPDEALDAAALIKEQYQGIRPAPGYPACPDHLVKKDLFALLQAQEIDMSLTERMAMVPASSVSGFYLAHPDAQYFNVGKIGEDQLHDLAARAGVEVDALRPYLGPNL